MHEIVRYHLTKSIKYTSIDTQLGSNQPVANPYTRHGYVIVYHLQSYAGFQVQT